MKLWALILAAGAILAFAVPAADAAAFSAGFGGSARTVNTIQRDGAHSTLVVRNLLHGQTAFLNQLDRPPTPATARLVRSGRLDDLVAPVVHPQPIPWLGTSYAVSSSAALIASLLLR